MKTPVAVGLATMVLLLAQFSNAQKSAPDSSRSPTPGSTQKAAGAPRQGEIDQVLVAKLFEAFRIAGLGQSQPCTDQSGTVLGTTGNCEVIVTMSTVSYGGTDYCVAQLPSELDFYGTKLFNKSKNIKWTLSADKLNGYNLQFHPKNGILAIDAGQGQVTPNSKPTKDTVFEAKNSHKLKESMTYVPIILWIVNNQPQLCAAADPKIVNN